MAIITPALITSLRTGFSKSFQDALATTPTLFPAHAGMNRVLPFAF